MICNWYEYFYKIAWTTTFKVAMANQIEIWFAIEICNWDLQWDEYFFETTWTIMFNM